MMTNPAVIPPIEEWEGKRYEEYKAYAAREGWALKSREDKRDFVKKYVYDTAAPVELPISDKYFEETYVKTTDWVEMTFKFVCMNGLIYPLSFSVEVTE